MLIYSTTILEPDANLGILIATIAYGMGLDYNVHPVVYWGASGNIYRRLVHTGRDGMPMQTFYGKLM